MSIKFAAKSIREAVREANATPGAAVSTSPGGSDEQVQYNKVDAFAGDGNLVYDYTNTRLGIGASIDPDEILHVAKATDGDSVLALLENSQANASASKNETAQLRFGFGGDNDVARIVVGKDNDYTSGALSDSFMAFYVDLNGTVQESLVIDSNSNIIVGRQGTAFPTVNASAKGCILLSTLSTPPSGGTQETVHIAVENRTGQSARAGLTIYPEVGPGGDGLMYIGDFVGIGRKGPTDLLELWSDTASIALGIKGKNSNGSPSNLKFAVDNDDAMVDLSLVNATSTPADDGFQSNKGFHLVIDSSQPEMSFEFDKEDPGTAITREVYLAIFRRTSFDLASGSTHALQRFIQFRAPDYVGVSGGAVETITDAATVYIDGAPTGTDVTFTNGPYALWIDDGAVRFDGDLLLSGGSGSGGKDPLRYAYLVGAS